MWLRLHSYSSLEAVALLLIEQQESERTTRVHLHYNLRLDSSCIADKEIDLEESLIDSTKSCCHIRHKR